MQLKNILRVVRQNRFVGLAIPIITILFITASFAHGQENETTYYFLTDHLGSTDVVLDEDGNVVERADYKPFGADRLRIEEPEAPETDYGFTGKERDEETGLHYYSARYYDSDIGRFVSVDNWEGDYTNPQTLNKYAYTLNNPLKYVDPSGNKVELVGRQVAFMKPAMHSFLRITPDNPSDFGVKNSFTFTMGGQGKQFGNIWGEFNNAGDLNIDSSLEEYHSEVIDSPGGNDTEFINSIFEVHSRLDNEKYDIASIGNQYNCNNYSSSLLLGAGAEDVPFNNFDTDWVLENGLGEAIPSMLDSANNNNNKGWKNEFNNKVIGPAILNDIMKEAVSKVKDYFTPRKKDKDD